MHIRSTLFAVLAVTLLPAALSAQAGRGAAPQTPRSSAPTDFTGYWVTLVTEDWLYRMVTPAKGDYAAVPLNPNGRKLADSWDPAKDEASGDQCKAYGAPAIMRIPGRAHITWQDDNTLKIEKDSGTQTRLLHFAADNSPGGDWQGVSTASWDVAAGARGPVRGGGMKVVTAKFKAGYLRKNGVPYSANAVVTEYYDRTNESNGDSWLIVETIVDDPAYLNQPFVTSTNFKKQADAAGWNSTPCTAR
ncbi:MAG TPA: hypothetical protein VGR73_19800 [Bryobacteraceae bacterium]|nr:hypothetical protein [Bryobacteraceae bacterium]